MSKYDKKLLESLATKIVEDCVVTLQEHDENVDENDEADELFNAFLEYYPCTSDSDDNDDDETFEFWDKADSNATTTYKETKNDFIKTLITRLETCYKREITVQITEPLINLFSKYIENSFRECPHISKTFIAGIEENNDEKYCIEEKRKQVASFQAIPFIINDLQKVIKILYEQNPQNELLKVIILYGHAIHKTATPTFIKVLFNVFESYFDNLGMLRIILQDDGKDIEFIEETQIEGRKKGITIVLILSNGYFYICQNDSKKIFKNKKDSDYVGSCLFEFLSKNNAEASDLYKLGEEAFRNMILKHL